MRPVYGIRSSDADEEIRQTTRRRLAEGTQAGGTKLRTRIANGDG